MQVLSTFINDKINYICVRGTFLHLKIVIFLQIFTKWLFVLNIFNNSRVRLILTLRPYLQYIQYFLSWKYRECINPSTCPDQYWICSAPFQLTSLFIIPARIAFCFFKCCQNPNAKYTTWPLLLRSVQQPHLRLLKLPVNTYTNSETPVY